MYEASRSTALQAIQRTLHHWLSHVFNPYCQRLRKLVQVNHFFGSGEPLFSGSKWPPKTRSGELLGGGSGHINLKPFWSLKKGLNPMTFFSAIVAGKQGGNIIDNSSTTYLFGSNLRPHRAKMLPLLQQCFKPLGSPRI